MPWNFFSKGLEIAGAKGMQDCNCKNYTCA